MRRPVLTSLLLAACVAACTPVPTTPKGTSPRKSAAPSSAPLIQPSGPAGVVPSHSVPGGGFVSNGSGNLIGKVKAPAQLISDKGNGLVGNNGGGLVGNNGGSYAVLAAPDQQPLAGVAVRLLDAAGNPVKNEKGEPLTTTTDAQGNYGFQTALPVQNLVVEVALEPGKGAVRAVVPREGSGQKVVEVDYVSTLTTSYILDQYVKTQKDPLATFERLPADVEAVTRERAQTAVAGGTAAVPDALTNEKVVATVDAIRSQDSSFNAQLETVKKLLVVAGASDLGTGLKATEVTIKNVDDLEVTPDGALYVLTTEDKRVWRVRPDGVIETAAGDRRPPDGQDLTGKLGPEASLDRPTSLAVDPSGRVLICEARGVYRLESDGKLTRVATPPRPGMDFAAGKDGATIVAVNEPIKEYVDMGWPEAMAPKAYAFYLSRPGTVADRIFEIVQDPFDDGTQTQFLKGLVWDGGNTVYLNVQHSTYKLMKYDLTAKTLTQDAGTPEGTLMLDGAGHLFQWTTGGDIRVRHLFKTITEKNVPVPPQHSSRLAFSADGKAYAAKWGMVMRLDTTGAVRVAGTEGQDPGGDAGKFTFEVLSGAAVTPDGTVYAIDHGKGGVYKVKTDRTIEFLGDTGRGGVQLLRTGPTGTIYMSDGNGTGLGSFDAQGKWTELGKTEDMIVDFVVGSGGVIYASTVSLSGERRYRIVKVENGVETVLETGIAGGLVALDPSGVLHVVGGGNLRKRVGSSWTVIKGDDRFDNASWLGGGPNITFDAQGRLYMCLPDQNKIVRYHVAGDRFESVAGLGTKHFAGTGTDDSLNKPRTPCFDADGNLYFADTGNRQVKRIAADGLP